jgi:3',5'-cyclic AMP phosphodiesterase CpdA
MSQPSITYYFAGDFANCDPGQNNILNGRRGHEYVADILSRRFIDEVNLLLMGGDLAYFQGSTRQFQNCFDPVFRKWKDFIRPTPGNHEYETPGATDYYSYFGGRFQSYYSWNPPGDYWHFIAGNTNLTGSEKMAYLNWLERDLTENSNRPCTVLFIHHPPFSSGNGGNNQERTDEEVVIFHRHHGDLILAGHDHDYERFEAQGPKGSTDPNGFVLFVVGTGGTVRFPLGSIKPHSATRTADAWGVLAVTLGPGTYAFDFLNASPDSKFHDAGSGDCHP